MAFILCLLLSLGAASTVAHHKKKKVAVIVQVKCLLAASNFFCFNKFLQVIWTVQYVNISGQLMDAMAFLLEHGWTIFTQTGVEASQKYVCWEIHSLILIIINYNNNSIYNYTFLV